MGTHLAAIHRIAISHHAFNKSMSGFTLYRLAAIAFDELNGIPGEPGVVHDTARRLLAQKSFSQKANQIIPLDKISVFVEEKATVKVAIPGYTKIRTRFPHCPGRHLAVLLDQRIGYAMGKGAIRRVMNFDKLKGKLAFEQIDNGAGTAVAGVHHNFQWAQARHIHVAQ